MPQASPQLPGKAKDDLWEKPRPLNPPPYLNPDSPVLHNPVLQPPPAHAVAHQQYGVVDVLRVTAGVVVDTWRGRSHVQGAFIRNHSSGGTTLTFAVELEGGQGGVDAHGDGPVLEQGVGQQLLVALRDLLVTAALGRLS